MGDLNNMFLNTDLLHLSGFDYLWLYLGFKTTIFGFPLSNYSILESQLTNSNLFSFSTLLTAFQFVKDSFSYTFCLNYTFLFTLKVALCLVFLAAIKGGVPRYRYDFLTKMGWVKFLGLVLSVFLASFLIFLIW